jgi:hypothetical protein
MMMVRAGRCAMRRLPSHRMLGRRRGMVHRILWGARGLNYIILERRRMMVHRMLGGRRGMNYMNIWVEANDGPPNVGTKAGDSVKAASP